MSISWTLGFVLSLFFFFTGMKGGDRCLLIRFNSVLLTLPVLSEFLLRVCGGVVGRSRGPVGGTTGNSFFAVYDCFLFV